MRRPSFLHILACTAVANAFPRSRVQISKRTFPEPPKIGCKYGKDGHFEVISEALPGDGAVAVRLKNELKLNLGERVILPVRSKTGLGKAQKPTFDLTFSIRPKHKTNEPATQAKPHTDSHPAEDVAITDVQEVEKALEKEMKELEDQNTEPVHCRLIVEDNEPTDLLSGNPPSTNSLTLDEPNSAFLAPPKPAKKEGSYSYEEPLKELGGLGSKRKSDSISEDNSNIVVSATGDSNDSKGGDGDGSIGPYPKRPKSKSW